MAKGVLKKLKFGDAVSIEWNDAGDSANGWTDLKDVTHEHPVISCGYFLKKTATYLYIANSIDKETAEKETVACTGAIPLGCIKNMKLLR